MRTDWSADNGDEGTPVPYEEVSAHPGEADASFRVQAAETSGAGESSGGGRVVLSASIGLQRSGGGAVSVTQVRANAGTVTVRLHVKKPSESEVVTAAMTCPACAVSCLSSAIPDGARVVFVNQDDEVLGEAER